MARPRVHTDDLRERLLADATGVIAGEGSVALTLRGLAALSGTSTTAVYSLFGSKDSLLQAVLTRAFDTFADANEQVPQTDDPVRDIQGLGATYVQWALDQPQLYGVMFGDALVGIGPGEECLAAAARAMAPLRSAVDRAIGQGVFRPADPETVMTSLWAQVHGLASLLLTGHLDNSPAIAEAASAAIDGWRA